MASFYSSLFVGQLHSAPGWFVLAVLTRGAAAYVSPRRQPWELAESFPKARAGAIQKRRNGSITIRVLCSNQILAGNLYRPCRGWANGVAARFPTAVAVGYCLSPLTGLVFDVFLTRNSPGVFIPASP